MFPVFFSENMLYLILYLFDDKTRTDHGRT